MNNIVFAGRGLKPVLELPVHHHEPWIVILYSMGVGEAIFDSVRLPFRRGTVLCVPPRMPYAEKSQRGFTATFIAFERLNLSKQEPHAFTDPHGRWLNIANLIVDILNEQSAHSREVAEHLFEAIARGLLPSKSAVGHPQVERLKDIIHQHWADPEFQIADAMAAIPMSPAHLRRTFAAQMDQPPVTYLLHHRVRHAQRLLAVGGFSVKQISQMCGFRDPYYFSRAFRSVTGRAPSLWKEATRTEK